MTDLFDPKHDRATACTDAARMLLPLLGGQTSSADATSTRRWSTPSVVRTQRGAGRSARASRCSSMRWRSIWRAVRSRSRPRPTSHSPSACSIACRRKRCAARNRSTGSSSRHLSTSQPGQYLIHGAGEFGHVDAETRVHDAFREDRQQHQARYDERAVRHTRDLVHRRADRGAEHHEIERRGDHRNHQAGPHRAPEARHFEAIDRPDAMQVHARVPSTRSTKISSSEDL